MSTSKRMRRFGDVSVRMIEPVVKMKVVKPVEIVSDVWIDAYHDRSWNKDAILRVSISK